jgi:hypothetical protein
MNTQGQQGQDEATRPRRTKAEIALVGIQRCGFADLRELATLIVKVEGGMVAEYLTKQMEAASGAR